MTTQVKRVQSCIINLLCVAVLCDLISSCSIKDELNHSMIGSISNDENPATQEAQSDQSCGARTRNCMSLD